MLTNRVENVVDVLAAYLFASTRIEWPGSDGMDVETVVKAHYPAASRAGHVPKLAELKQRHLFLADALEEFFACARSAEATYRDDS